jgi:glyoxylate utilization-related uncharacterized protein
VFFVAEGQPGSLEVAYAHADESEFVAEKAHRFLLSPGDQFFIPPHNVYRLENHSATTDVKIYWTIVKVGATPARPLPVPRAWL